MTVLQAKIMTPVKRQKHPNIQSCLPSPSESCSSSPGMDTLGLGVGFFRKLTHIAPLRHTRVPKIFALVYLHFQSNLSNLITHQQLGLGTVHICMFCELALMLQYKFSRYNTDLRQAAMTKMKPGQRLGMAEAIAGEVRSTPSIMMTWYIDTLHNTGWNFKLVQ